VPGCGAGVGLLMCGCAPQDGDTPLRIAMHNGHAEVVRVLVVAGADTDVKTKVRERIGGNRGRTHGVRFPAGDWITAAARQCAEQG